MRKNYENIDHLMERRLGALRTVEKRETFLKNKISIYEQELKEVENSKREVQKSIDDLQVVDLEIKEVNQQIDDLFEEIQDEIATEIIYDFEKNESTKPNYIKVTDYTNEIKNLNKKRKKLISKASKVYYYGLRHSNE